MKTTKAAERKYLEMLKRLIPALVELSVAAHVMVDEQSGDDTACDRVFWLGEIAENLGVLCPASARVLSDISAALLQHAHHDEDEVEPTTAPGSATEH